MSYSPVLGGELLGVITAGMYDNPLVLYREYVQNAADAIVANGSVSGSVRVTIDPIRPRITILDNGTGIEPKEAVHRLMDLGRSLKDPSIDRGFRGIGRLSGLAFADELHFTTRTCANERPMRVSWNGRKLRTLDLARIDAKNATQECVTTSAIDDDDWPARFFQVDIDHVNRHVVSTLLNADVVRCYLGEIGPVPLAKSFPFSKAIAEFLDDYTDNLVLDIRVNDDSHPIQRPFKESIALTKNFDAPFESLETRVIPSLDSDDPAAVLWLAHTTYSGSISRQLGVRGLRARIGNLQIGTDRIFEHLFLEPRFNGWCVGEVNILDNRIVPNGRRDYFEPSPHLRNLENHIGALAQHISLRCRRASSHRNKLHNLNASINQIKSVVHLVRSGYLHNTDAVALVARERKRILDVRKTLAQVEAGSPHNPHEELAQYEVQFDEFEANPNSASLSVLPRSGPALEAAFGTIARSVPPDTAVTLIEAILHDVVDSDRLRNTE